MKITDAYLQNQPLSRTQHVRPKKETGRPEFRVPDKPPASAPKGGVDGVSFEMSRESQRILSLREKQSIAELFMDAEKTGKTYTAQGQVARLKGLLGQKIDVKG